MSDPGFHSPLVDFFRRGEVARDVRLLAAQGALAPRAHEQLALLMLLSDDPDREIKQAATATLDALPVDMLAGFLARADVPQEMRAFFAALGVAPAEGSAAESADAPIVDATPELPQDPAAAEPTEKMLSLMSVLEKMKIAMKGTREQGAQLVRDPNKLVSAAVLSSPKLTPQEVETFTKMGNVSEDTLRTIGNNRAWLKHYGIVTGLCRNPKTPLVISMRLVNRLNERELKGLTTDRNAQEGLRALARKLLVSSKT